MVVIRAEYWILLILVEYFYTFCQGYWILVVYEIEARYEKLNGNGRKALRGPDKTGGIGIQAEYFFVRETECEIK
jgi:hypothetical protein